ncbi:MAG TPA: DUF6542 domain-containing protein [Mycobacterium sp.]|uniref:DUF6542 domain-containing protein n=1 Tax=Mycobacterium sp. TaxID=1785 RepID=UPI002F40B4D3
MSGQQDRSAVTDDHRSIVPGIPGVPWWAAVVVAVTGCAVGFAFDAGSGKELTSVFSGLYVVGCLAAVLAVRQSGIFTAIVQPPLILFCAVPGAYFLFHGAKFTGIKDLLINCGYPLIERFPLMLFTSAGVLLVGLVRWTLGRFDSQQARAAAAATDASDTAGEGGRLGLVARLTAMFDREPADDETVDKAARPRTRRTHTVERSARATTADGRRTGQRPASSRTRRARPALDDAADPAGERARRRRPTREFDTSEPPRRSRLPRDPDLRGRPPREVRRDPHARRDRPTTRSSRFDPYEPVEPFDAAPAPTPRRRPAPNGATATHHPISQVRYRKAAGAEESYNDRPRRPRDA